MTASHLQPTPEVAAALSAGTPVVALESTLVSHGLPPPHNLDTAWAAEQAVRDAGAVPATIAVLDGQLHIGLDQTGMERLAKEPGMAKLSRRDLPLVLAAGKSGATTVAATMIAARAAGIRVFATGGIGGVHPGAEETFDISADLAELARTDTVVVCSGAKAILDLPRTRELLETLGVPVVGYRTDWLPGFWTTASALAVDWRIDEPSEIAGILEARKQLDLHGGVLLCNPVPAAQALDQEQVDSWIAQANKAAQADSIVGQALTPYLLAKVAELSGNTTLKTNIALIVSNAGVAGAVARFAC